MTSIPSSHTSQPSPHAPSTGLSQLSSTKRTSWARVSMPRACQGVGLFVCVCGGVRACQGVGLFVGVGPDLRVRMGLIRVTGPLNNKTGGARLPQPTEAV